MPGITEASFEVPKLENRTIIHLVAGDLSCAGL